MKNNPAVIIDNDNFYSFNQVTNDIGEVDMDFQQQPVEVFQMPDVMNIQVNSGQVHQVNE